MSFSKGRKPYYDRVPRTDHKSSKGPKPSAAQKNQPKGKPRGSRGKGRKDPKAQLGASGPGRTSGSPGTVLSSGTDTVPHQPDQFPGPHPSPHWLSFSTRMFSVAGQRSQWQVTLAHFLPFWREVIQANRWVLEVVSEGYSIELLQTSQFQGIRNTLPPLAEPDILSEEAEHLLRKGVVKPVPLDQERSGFYSTSFLVPM